MRSSYPLTHPTRISLSTLALRTGVHPDLLRRFVALGLLDATRGSGGELWFPLSAAGSVARIQRLRMGLSLNYAAVGVVLDLLDRIHELELQTAQTTSHSTRRSERTWISIG